MNRSTFITTTAALVCAGLLSGAAAAKDVAGSKDHPLVGRYAGSEIIDYKSEEFNEQRFITSAVNLKTEGEAFTEANSIKAWLRP